MLSERLRCRQDAPIAHELSWCNDIKVSVLCMAVAEKPCCCIAGEDAERVRTARSFVWRELELKS